MTENVKNIQFALGLAQKAGKLVSGDWAVRDSLKQKKIKLIVLATDASQNSKKEVYQLARSQKIEIIEEITACEIGSAIGKGKRICAGILDINFVNLLKSKRL